jgi:hypothetical protein
MCFTKIQQDIIQVVFESHEDPNCPHESCIEGLQTTLKHRYDPEEIEGNVLKLISKGVFEPYFFQSHLRFTERFKQVNEYKEFMDHLSYAQKL